MTRDEHRAMCIEAMRSAVFMYRHAHRQFDWNLRDEMTIAFDALNGIAFVDPIEATDEMIYIGELAKADGGDVAMIFACTKADGADVARIFASMAKVGNLTNETEKKS